MKHPLLLSIGLSLILLSSCLDSMTSDFEIPIPSSHDAQIRSLSLSTARASGIDSAVFTIDQINGKIFNKDSIRMGTKLGKALLKMETDNALYAVIRPLATKDTIYWTGADSIDISKPVFIDVAAQDGRSTKKYRLSVGVYTHDPDAMIWSEIADPFDQVSYVAQRLFPAHASAGHNDQKVRFVQDAEGTIAVGRGDINDIAQWRYTTTEGLPNDAKLASMVHSSTSYYVVDAAGSLYSSEDGESWTSIKEATPLANLYGTTSKALYGMTLETPAQLATINLSTLETTHLAPLPSTFPIKEFARHQYQDLFVSRLAIFAGTAADGSYLNTVWRIIDGQQWTELTQGNQGKYPARTGVAMIPYDNRWMLIGGHNAEGQPYPNDIYFSEDEGGNWTKAPVITRFPLQFEGRMSGEVVVDKTDHIHWFGGINENNEILNDYWRGAINRVTSATHVSTNK